MCASASDILLDSEGSPPPRDLRVDAFCIGAAKSGSTWLARVIDQHPEIQVSSPKEPNFLTQRGSAYLDRPPRGFLSSWSWYGACFPEEGKVNIDFSIHTMADPEAPRRIQSVFPEARFLLILRDPVRRLYSHYRHEERTKLKGIQYVQGLEPTFEDALKNDEFVRRSRYAELLQPWMACFPRERFHVMTTEAARKEPERHVREAFRFLGVDDSFRPVGLRQKHHPHRLDRGLLRRLNKGAAWARSHGLGWFIGPIGRRFPYRFVKRFDKKTVRYPPLDPRMEGELRQRFLPDVERTEQMLGLDLDAWKPEEPRSW